MATETEGVFELPTEAARNLAGFSLDIGGSVCKVIYRDKDDWENFQKEKPEPKTAKLRLTLFRTDDASQAFQLLKDKCHILRTADVQTPTVYTTGYGSNVGGKTIEEMLDVKVSNQSEFDCFVNGFRYITKNISPKDYLIPLNNEVLQNSYKLVKEKIDSYQRLVGPDKIHHTHTDTPSGPQYSLPRPLGGEVAFPALLIMCGSAVGVFKISENGDFSFLDGSNNGGRTFLGLASLLIGAKSYDEIIDLASKGDNSNVDLFPKDLDCRAEDGDAAQALGAQKEGDIVVNFQKALDMEPETFKREDLALSLVNLSVHQLAQMVMYSSIRSKIRQAFFCGSFFNRSLVRDVMTASLTKRMIFVDSLQNGLEVDMGFHFIKNGSHLGAMGALMYPLMAKSKPAQEK